MREKRDHALVELVIGERVEGIDQERPYAGFAAFGVAFFQQRVEQRVQEALGLAAAGPGGHDDVFPTADDGPQRFRLMTVQWPRELTFRQSCKIPVQQGVLLLR